MIGYFEFLIRRYYRNELLNFPGVMNVNQAIHNGPHIYCIGYWCVITITFYASNKVVQSRSFYPKKGNLLGIPGNHDICVTLRLIHVYQLLHFLENVA